MFKRAQKVRLAIVFCSYLFILLVIFCRLLHVQVLNSDYYVKLAQSQHELTLKLYPQRGLIYDRNEKVFALSLKVFSVYAVPRQIENKEETAKELSDILNVDFQETLEKLKKDKSFVWIKRRVDKKEAQLIKLLRSHGVDMIRENKRYYPKRELAAHLIGFAGVDEQGLEGIELQYDAYLKGQSGHRSLIRDAKQRMLPAFEYEFVPAVDGYNVILTIDEVIQHIVEEELDKAFEESNALGASVIVMNPSNGQVYALANRPAFDPNFFGSADLTSRRNRTVCDYYEPGSTFKIITAIAALEEKVVALDEIFFCENGSYRISKHVLHDHKPHGDLTFVEIIEKSSNIGVVKVAQRLGAELLYKYIRKLEFGKKTGIDLPGETPGFIRHWKDWSKLSIAAVPIGQEIGVSVLQMLRAMAVIANSGYLVKPHLVQKIVDNNGEIIKTFEHLPRMRIISSDTSEIMKQILKGVVDRGTGVRAQIDGYEVAGKTGTAQKIESTGAYSHKKFIASFIGFAPVENPRFVIAVVFDEPYPYYYGGLVCAPVFKNIAEKILKYLNIHKDKMILTDVKGKN